MTKQQSNLNIFGTDKKYQIIYADPPWRYQDKGCSGSAEKHYSTMGIDDICSLPVKDIADKNSVLFVWVTYPMLAEGLKLIEAWGFKYKTIGFQWIKTNKKIRTPSSSVLGDGRAVTPNVASLRRAGKLAV